MIINIDSISNVGLVRKNNEDFIFDGARFIRDDKHNYSLSVEIDKTKIMFAVADGMGGHNAGELASEILLTELNGSLSNIFRDSNILSQYELKAFFDTEIKRIHNMLIQEGINDPNKYGMGSTFIGFIIYMGNFYSVNAGDSRLYRMRDGYLKQLSKDHSYSSMFGNERGSSHLIYNAVGGGDRVFIDFTNLTSKIGAGDIILLCSDGLTDMLEDDTIEEILNDDGTTFDLVNSALQRGGVDNISVIKLEILE
ncbi:MAG TPA: protein phosphatase 2C domain-containing protein [Melioribacteraceae bacterium]|nr:protein phosphatase 2C domain-containing protein [Melioribacteraceae bacterium]